AVYLAGGGSTPRPWQQLLCDLLGKTLLVLEEPNASARGAALLAGRAADLIEDVGPALAFVDRVEPAAGAHRSLGEAFARWKAVPQRPGAGDDARLGTGPARMP
ncbi:MAG: FGGY-family carbohydrate kinase, partial [Acidimicrobiales bacterium]